MAIGRKAFTDIHSYTMGECKLCRATLACADLFSFRPDDDDDAIRTVAADVWLSPSSLVLVCSLLPLASCILTSSLACSSISSRQAHTYTHKLPVHCPALVVLSHSGEATPARILVSTNFGQVSCRGNRLREYSPCFLRFQSGAHGHGIPIETRAAHALSLPLLPPAVPL